MTIAPYQDLVERVSLRASGAPDAVILREIESIAREICATTNVWRLVMPAIRLTAGVNQYDYDIPEEAQVNIVSRVRVNGRPIQLTTLDILTEAEPLWPDYRKEYRGMPRIFVDYNLGEDSFGTDSGTFAVSPVPDDKQTYDLDAVMSLLPRRGAEGVPETIMDKIEQALVEGSIYRVLTVGDENWSNTERAAHAGRQFQYYTSTLRANELLSATRGSVRARIPMGFSK